MARAVDWRPGMANVGTVRSGERQFSVIVISDDQQPASAAELADVFGELGKLSAEAVQRQQARLEAQEAERRAAEEAAAKEAAEAEKPKPKPRRRKPKPKAEAST